MNKNLFAFSLSILFFIAAPFLYHSPDTAQGVVKINEILYKVRAWKDSDDNSTNSSSYASAELLCATYTQSPVLELCTTQLAQQLESILELQQKARTRYSTIVQYWWMSSVKVHTSKGTFVLYYLPLFEPREVVINNFLDDFNIRKFVKTQMGEQQFIEQVKESMDQTAQHRGIFLSLLLSATFAAAASSCPKILSTRALTTAASHTQRLPCVDGTLSAALRTRDKDFASKLGQARLALAFLVVVFHSMEETHNEDWLDPFHKLFSCDLGTFAASITHAISGVLAHDSVHRHGPVTFFERRILRLWPAFFALGFLAVGLLGPLVSQMSPLSFARSRGGRRIFWWCVSGESLLGYSPAEGIMTFEEGDAMQMYALGNRKKDFFRGTKVAGALWSMPQLVMSWIVLASLHAFQSLEFSVLMFVALGTCMAAGSSKYIYVASFFIGAAGASKAEHISLDIANTGAAVKLFSAWALLTVVLERVECWDVTCSSTNVWKNSSQIWKVLVVICTHSVFAWSNVKAAEDKAVANDDDVDDDDDDARKKKPPCCSVDCGSLVLGVYVFGSGVQSVLRILVERVAELDGAKAALLNLCLSVPIVTVLAALFARVYGKR